SKNLYQPKSFNENLTSRNRRQISQCETWSSWVDNNHPVIKAESEEERFTEKDLEAFCPANLGTITGFQCKDDRGEPRSNILNETSKDGRYSFSCYDYTIGVKSHNLYQPKAFNENRSIRNRRQMSKCETWSDWVDINHPFNIGDSDEEHFTEYDLESFCPANLGSITGFQCKDDRGEPRSNILNETSKDGRYSFSCYDYTIGVNFGFNAIVSIPKLFKRLDIRDIRSTADNNDHGRGRLKVHRE
ncbi:hypothetical protein MAR_000564, partial [Mya arenaria]